MSTEDTVKQKPVFICSSCGKQYKSRREITHHINSKCGTLKLFECEVCKQKLMTAGSLHNHLLRHTGEKDHMCGFCGKTFLANGQLKIHERVHTQEKVFFCNVCGKGFCHRQSLKTHNTVHTGIKPYECNSCGRCFSCVGNLLKHRLTRANTCGLFPIKPMRAQDPNAETKDEEEHTPKTHSPKALEIINCKTDNARSNSHNQVEEVIVVRSETLEPIQLQEQPKSTNNYQTKTRSQKSSDAKEEDKIEPIDKTKRKKRKAVKRTTKPKRQRLTKEKTLDDPIVLQCNLCDRKFNNTARLTKHEKSAHKLKSLAGHKCQLCKATFEGADEYERHKREAHASSLTCEECKKSFANPYSLRAHENVVHRGRVKKTYVYVCEVCGKQFKQKIALTVHTDSNCGRECSVPCKVCKKPFYNVHTMEAHMKVHDPAKRFLCRFCGKNFRWKGQLKVHERCHTGEKPYNCLFCPKAFAHRESLITHSSLHTGIKPYLCRACGSRFSCIGNLNKHRDTHASSCGVWYQKNQSDRY